MSRRETIDGKPISSATIAQWAAEAEAGFDVDALVKRGRGRPGRSRDATQVVTVRLTDEEIAAIDARAVRDATTRSQAIRAAITAYTL